MAIPRPRKRRGPMSLAQKAALKKAQEASARARRGTGKIELKKRRPTAKDYRAQGDKQAREMGMLDRGGSDSRKLKKAIRGSDITRDATPSRANNPRTKFDRNSGNQTVTRFTPKQRAAGFRKGAGLKKPSPWKKDINSRNALGTEMTAKIQDKKRADTTRNIARQQDTLNSVRDNAQVFAYKLGFKSEMAQIKKASAPEDLRAAVQKLHDAIGTKKLRKAPDTGHRRTSATDANMKSQLKAMLSEMDSVFGNSDSPKPQTLSSKTDSPFAEKSPGSDAMRDSRMAQKPKAHPLETAAGTKPYMLKKKIAEAKPGSVRNQLIAELNKIRKDYWAGNSEMKPPSSKKDSKPAMVAADPATMSVGAIVKERKELLAKKREGNLSKEEASRLVAIQAESSLRTKNRKEGKGAGPTKVSMAKKEPAKKTASTDIKKLRADYIKARDSGQPKPVVDKAKRLFDIAMERQRKEGNNRLDYKGQMTTDKTKLSDLRKYDVEEVSALRAVMMQIADEDLMRTNVTSALKGAETIGELIDAGLDIYWYLDEWDGMGRNTSELRREMDRAFEKLKRYSDRYRKGN